WLERLKISRGERRAVIVLIMLLLILAAANAFVKPKPPFERSKYAEIETVFKQRTALLKNRNKKIMAPFKGIPASAVTLDTLPGSLTIKQQEPINVNKAGAKTLAKLPGIGPAYARNIIEYRKENGLFTAKEELMRVKGIGKARLSKIKSLIILGKVSKQAAVTESTFDKQSEKDEHY